MYLQLRLDFSTFVITGPSTNTASTAKELGGTQIQGAGAVVSPATNCLTGVEFTTLHFLHMNGQMR